MTHPNAYDDLPWMRVAIYALHCHGIRLWQLPETWQHRVMLVAIEANPDMQAVAANVCREAVLLMDGIEKPKQGRQRCVPPIAPHMLGSTLPNAPS